MRLLDMDESWNLFSKIVFPRDDYPSKMVEIGKKMVRNCKGLPLSIVVVGGFLSKSEYKREYWEYIEENLSSFVNSDNNEHCLEILQLSYIQLPVHLKPCFLYMGVFEEDEEIYISKLVMLWVVEAFLKPISGKNLEEVAEEYLNDLVDRNLVKRAGNRVNIHDLLRDLYLKQAKVEKFYNVVTHENDCIPNNQHCIVVHEDKSEDEGIHDYVLESIRSLIYRGFEISMPTNCRLLRIYVSDEYTSNFGQNKLQLFNLRYLDIKSDTLDSRLTSSLYLLWNLQTLILDNDYGCVLDEPLDIWNMPQLRHVQVKRYVYLPDPPVCNGEGVIVLENLQMLALVRNFKCSEEVVKRIPNIKELRLEYNDDEEESCLNNLDRLHKLKKFSCEFVIRPYPERTDFMQKLTFPLSLNEIKLVSNNVHWADMLKKIGSLPLLRSLYLHGGVFMTGMWNTVEGQFSNLKSLELSSVGLQYWNSESSHFPRLERIVLRELKELKNITSGIGDIPTLRSIELAFCSKSAVISCKRMQEKQEELYGGEEDLIFQVEARVMHQERKALQYLASPNFKVID